MHATFLIAGTDFMKNTLLKSLLLFLVVILLGTLHAKADIFWTEDDGDWDDPNIWNSLFSGSNVVPGNTDDITLRHIVTLTGNRTLTAGGKVTIGGLFGAAVLKADNITNFGEIVIEGNGKLLFNRINNEASAEINNFGLSSGNEIINALSGTIHNRPFGTLLLQDKLVNTGAFTNTANALLNVDRINNLTGLFTNEGLVRCRILRNDQDGDFTNSKRIEVGIIHNGADEIAATNGSGNITNNIGSTIIISDHIENYSGTFNNHGIMRVNTYWVNYDRFRVGVTGKLYIEERAINEAAGPSGLGVLKLFGIIYMGKPVVHLDAIPASGWQKRFINDGIIEGNGNGGVYAKEDNTIVENNGSITTGALEVFLCIGTPANYTDNGGGDFTQDCCFLLKADAGKDQTFCHNVLPYAPIGGSPTASMGVRPYSYTWSPASNLSNSTGANGSANPPNEQVYTINIVDQDGCTASDNVTITPETTNPIANAGDNQTICPGASATLGGTPSGTCGTGGLTYNWQIAITPTIFMSIVDNTNTNPTVSPNATSTYRLTVTDAASNTDVDFITVQVHSDVIANAGVDATACGSSYTMQASLGNGQSGTWSTTSGTGVASDPSNPHSDITGLTNGAATTLKWSITNGICNDNDQVIITGGGITQATVTNTDITECVPSFPTASMAGILDGNLVTNGGETGEWVVLSGNESQLTLDKNNPFSNITFTQADVYELKWTITDGSCTTESVLKTITVNENTTTAGPSITDCANPNDTPIINLSDAPTLNGGETGTWTFTHASGVADSFDFADNSQANTAFKVYNITTFPYKGKLIWTVSKAGNCDTKFEQIIDIYQLPTANAGSDDTATGATYNMQADALGANETGLWAVVTNIGGVTTGDLTDPNMVISGTNATDAITLTWAVTNTVTSCSTTSAQVTISGAACSVTQATVIDDDIVYCETASAFPYIVVLDGNIPMGLETGKWNIISSVGGAIDIDDDTNPTSDIKFAGAGEYELTWTITNGSCSTVATKKIIVVEQENGFSGTTECTNSGNDITINMDVSFFKTGKAGSWSAITKIDGDAAGWAVEDPNSPTSNLNITNVFAFPFVLSLNWTVNESGCISSHSYPIIINKLPTANAGADATATGTTYNMQADALGANEDGLWVIGFKNEVGITFSDLTDPNMQISNLTPTSNVAMKWEVTNTVTSCINTSNEITIAGATCGSLTTANVVAPIKTNCNQNFPYISLLDGNAPTVGETGKWVVETSSTAAATFTDDANSTTVMEVTAPGVLDLTWTITDGGSCTSTATKTITVVQTEYVALALSQHCLSLGDDFTFDVAAAGFIGGAAGEWSYIPSSGTADSWVFDSPISTNTNTFKITNITALPITGDLKWTVNHSGCISVHTIPLQIDETPVVNPGTDAIICSDTYTMEAILNAGETGIWTQTGGTAVTMGVDTDPNMTITDLTVGEVITMNWTVTNTTTLCENNKKVDITTQAVIAPIEGPAFNSCAYPSDTRIFNLTGTPLTGTQVGIWTYHINNGTANSFSFSNDTNANSQFKIDNVLTFPVKVVVTWTISDTGVCDKEYTHDIIINDNPNVPAGSDLELTCANPVINIGTGVPEVGKTYIWTSVGGNFVTVSNQLNVDVDQAGTYTLTVQNISTGCSYSNTITVTENITSPLADAGSDKEITCGSANVQIGNGTISAVNRSYEWTAITGNILGPTNTVIVIADQPGDYELKVTDDLTGCFAYATMTVTMAALPIADAGADHTICGTSYTLQGSTPELNETGVWSETSSLGVTLGNLNDPNMVISGLPMGQVVTMLWTVTHDITGCKTEPKVNITTQAAIATVELPQEDVCSTNGSNELVELSTNVPALTGAQSGKWTYIHTSGTADFSFSGGIDTAPNSQFSIANISGFQIVVDLTWTVTEAGECDLEYTKKITINDTPFANPGGPKTIDCINSDATIGTGIALAGYSYKWTNSSSDVVGSTPTITVSVADTYTLLVTIDASGCNNSNSVTVTNTGSLPIADAGTDQTIDCINTDATIGTGTALAGHTYEWKNSSNAVVGNTITMTVTTDDTYTLVVTNTGTGCISLPSDVTVTNMATLPIADAGTDKIIGCTSTTATIGTAAAPLANHTYKWKTLDGNFVGVDNQINVAVNQAGTYTLTVTNTATGCVSLSVNISVTNTATLPIADAGTDQTIDCINTDATIGTGVALAGHTYEWKNSSNAVVGNTITMTVTTADTYTLVVTNTGSGCISLPSNVTVTNTATLPTANAGTTQEINCTNPSVTIGTGTAQAGYSYQWNTISGNITSAANNITATVDQPGTYTLKVTNDATTCFATDDVVITSDIAVPIANAGLDIFLCNDFTTTLNATLPVTSTGLWEVEGGGAADIVSPTDPKTEITGLNSNSTVTLKWTEDNGCGTDSKTITITTSTAPTVSNAGPLQTLCEGTTNTLLEGNNPTSGSGKWTVVSGTAILADEFLYDSSISGLTDGSSSVLKWTITNGGCPISESEVTIKVLEPKAIEKTAFQICDGESAQLLATGGISYAWSPSEGLDAVDIPNPVATPSITTTYTVIINGGGTCGSTTKEVKVNVSPIPIVTITEDATINIGESIDLLATGGTGYSWSPAEGLDNASIPNPVATPAKTTTYNVTVSNIDGCSAEASVTIEVKEDFEIFVPQMFEPNSNTNNIVKVNTIGIKSVVFKIYNRSNKEIFSTTDGSIGWDGKYNGTLQNMDTYVYVVIAETYAGTKITRQGSIQLVR